MTAKEALDAIHYQLDGKEWDSGTMERVAHIVEAAGYTIHDSDDPAFYPRSELVIPQP